jgi:4-azaleucine resistance transporter AzlC
VKKVGKPVPETNLAFNHNQTSEKPKLTLTEGIKNALPIFTGYLPLGAAYGILGRQAGLNILETVVMSVMVFAGSAQFIAAGMIGAGVGPLTIIITTALVNLRHLLMSASLAKAFRDFPAWLQAVLPFWLTDEAFVVCSSALEGRTATPSYVAGLQITGYLGWVTGSFLGTALGNMASAFINLGIDYALPAMYIALLVMQIKNRTAILVGLLSGAVSLLLALTMPGNGNIIAATLIAATAGVFMEK